MAHQLFQLPKATPLNTGTIMPGAEVSFFLTGTSTPTPVYTDSGLSIAHTQPVVANAAGTLAPIYLDPAIVYKATITSSADVLLYTVDPVNDQLLSQAIIGGYLYPQTDAEVSAGVTPVNYAYAPGDVRRYGTNTTPGTTVMTTAIANALKVSASHRTIFQPETYLTGLLVFKSGYNVYMPPGCELLDTGALGINDRFFNISSEVAGEAIDKVRIEAWGAKLTLIKANYGSGEQRHAVFIAGDVKNILIEGLAANDSGGDGFCIGTIGGGSTLTPENIRLRGISANNNRRQGLSLTAARHFLCDSGVFTNTVGTSPQKGIDVEVDSSGGAMVGDLEDCVFRNCYTSGNAGVGYGFIQPYTAVGKRISVTFEDCISVGDAGNFQMVDTRDYEGCVTWKNCLGFDAKANGFEAVSSAMNCLVDGMWIFDANQDGNVPAHQGASYTIFSANGTNGSTYGNLTIRNSFARGTSAVKAFTQLISGEASSVMNDVDVEINTDAAVTKRASYGLLVGQMSGLNRVTFSDETEIPTTVSLGASTTPAYLSDTVTNAGAVGQVVINLSDPLTRLPGVRIKFRVKAAQNVVLDPSTGWTIAGGGAALWSNQVGAEVTLESDGTSTWRIVQGGTGWFHEPVTLANSATPSVAGITACQTGGTTTITALTGGVLGQRLTIFVKHAITFDTTGTTLKGNGGVDIAAANGDKIEAVFDGTNWLLTFSDCT